VAIEIYGGDEHKVTAVEINSDIAGIYKGISQMIM